MSLTSYRTAPPRAIGCVVCRDAKRAVPDKQEGPFERGRLVWEEP